MGNIPCVWQPIANYDPNEYDWVLLRYTIDNDFECIPIVAEKSKVTGKWKALSMFINDSNDFLDDIYINFKPIAFFDMHLIEKQPKTVTNADWIRSLDDNDLYHFLEENCMVEGVWADWFSEKFCGQCPTQEGIMGETGKKMEFAPCEVGENWCGHCDDTALKVWLTSPHEKQGYTNNTGHHKY